MYVTYIVPYCRTFNKAYRLKELQEDLKCEPKTTCGKLAPDSMLEKESFKTAANSRSCPGMKVGSFHEMEREPSLVYIDFVQQQITDLLLTHRSTHFSLSLQNI